MPLPFRLSSTNLELIVVCDDTSAASQIRPLREWWDHLADIGPDFGHYPNAEKTWIVVKDEKYEEAAKILTLKDGDNLAVQLDLNPSLKAIFRRKLKGGLMEEILQLSKFAATQPHTACAAFSHGLSSRWNFVLRTVRGTEDLLQPLEGAIRYHFLPSLTG